MTTETKNALKEILQSTLSVSKELEALHKEHQKLLTNITEDTVAESNHYEMDSEERDFEIILKDEKVKTVNQSLSNLKKGMEETQVMMMLSNHVASLEAEKFKLKAQVKRLCSENSWLRKSLTESQQLLQEAEITLAKLREDNEHLEFLNHQRDKLRSTSSYTEVVEEQEEDTTNERDSRSIPEDFSVGYSHRDMNSLENSINADYEIPEKIKTLHQLSLQYIHQGKPEIAIPLCRKAVQELEQKTGRNNPDLASLLNILVVIYREQGRYKEATRVLMEVLEIRENVFGVKHPIVAATLNNMSVLYGKNGEYRIAEPFCRRALEIRQELLGPSHPDVAKQFNNLAILCSHLGRYDEVEHYYQRALEIFETELGPDDLNVTKTINNLANCYLKQGKYKSAETMFRKVLKSVQKEEGVNTRQSSPHREDTDLWDMRKSPSSHSGRWHRTKSPIESPTLSGTLKNLTDTFRAQGRMEDAAELERVSNSHSTSLRSYRDHSPLIYGERSLPGKLDKEVSPTSSRKAQKLRTPVSWGWMFGNRKSGSSLPQLTDFSMK